MGIKSTDLSESTRRQMAAQDASGAGVLAPVHWQMTLPYPPTANTYYRHDRGKTHISTKGKAYRQTVLALTRGSGGVRGRVFVEVAVYLPDRRRRDLDNLTKSLFDALQYAEVVADDKLIRDFRIYDAGLDRPDGHVVVRVEAMV